MTEEVKPSGQGDAGSTGQPGKSGNGDSDSLSALLDSYKAGGAEGDSEKTEKPEGGDKDGLAKELAATRDELRELKARLLEQDDRQAETALLSEVQGDLKVQRTTLRGWIQEQLDDSPKLKDIFDKRSEDPDSYKKMVAGLKDRFSKYVGKEFPDPDHSGSRVRGAKGAETRPTPKSIDDKYKDVDWGSLSDTDLAKKRAEVFADLGEGPLF